MSKSVNNNMYTMSPIAMNTRDPASLMLAKALMGLPDEEIARIDQMRQLAKRNKANLKDLDVNDMKLLNVLTSKLNNLQ